MLKVMYNDQLVYKVVFFTISLLKEHLRPLSHHTKGALNKVV